MSKIDFSAVMTVYNTNPAHLYESVHSLLNQTLKQRFKLIIVNDGSNEHQTLRALDSLNFLPDVQVVDCKDNMGTPIALNIARNLVESPYIVQMDSDDISHPQRLEMQVNYLLKNPRTDVLGTNLFSFYDDDLNREPIYTSDHAENPPLRQSLNKFWIVNHGTVMYRKEAVDAVGGYNEKLRRAQDVDLWARMHPKGYQFRNVKQVLYAWRRKRR